MELTITRPDDWHLHVRDGHTLVAVIAHTATRFGRAIIMPNLNPPVTTTSQALAYRERILGALPAGSDFTPLMTLYLTDNTSAAEITTAANCGHIHAVKLYPAGATTHSAAGVTDLSRTWAALEAMQEYRLPLLVHAEVTDPAVDVFDREAVFIERHLLPLTGRFPKLRLVLEHVTTREGIDFVTGSPDTVAATLTAHHLLLNRNAMFRGGIRPHTYCLPVLKRESHREALLQAATGGNRKFFLGTDSAPHARENKESACGCAGIYTAHAALELYAQVFEQAGALDRLEDFASRFGAEFYGLPPNPDSITLEQADWQVPDSYPLGDSRLIPLYAGETLRWRIRR
jgi:dihydroorotase